MGRIWSNGTGIPINASNLNALESDLTSAPKPWKASTSYSAGQAVLDPSGNVVTANAAHTSGTTFTPANWTNPSTAGFTGRRTLLALGNSITNWWASGTRFTDKLAAFVGDTGAPFNLVNAGIGGNTTADQLSRLPALLKANSPTWVTIVPSVNDRKTGGLTPPGTIDNVRKMIGITRWAGALPVLMTEPPLDPPLANATDPTFIAASEYDRRATNTLVRSLATELGVTLADVDLAFATNDTSASADGIHPTGTTTSGYNGLDIICTTLSRALLTASPTVYGWPHIKNTQDSTDAFTRADSTTTLGGSWTADTGTWGISGNAAYSATNTAWDKASIAVSNADHVAYATILGAANTAYTGYIATRYTTSAGGFYLASLEVSSAMVGTLKLYAVLGQTPTQLGATVTVPGTMGTSATLELASVGTTHTVRVNGITLIRATDSTYTTGTRAAMVSLATGSKFDDFTVYV